MRAYAQVGFSVNIYIYIWREREREREMYMYMHIYIYIYIYICIYMYIHIHVHGSASIWESVWCRVLKCIFVHVPRIGACLWFGELWHQVLKDAVFY